MRELEEAGRRRRGNGCALRKRRRRRGEIAAKSTIAAIASFKSSTISRWPRRTSGWARTWVTARRNLRGALARLNASPGIQVLAVSRFRETKPVGFTDQPKFVNAAAAVETELEPRPLLEALLAIELAMGRTRRARGSGLGRSTSTFSSTRIGSSTSPGPIPHPRLHERAFVLEPPTWIRP